MRLSTPQPGRPDEFVKKCPKCRPTHFFVKIYAFLILWEKEAQNLVFSYNCPK
jgi:hypothetical protein